MTRSLYVISHIPLPLNVGGNLRPYHLLRALGAVSDVTLVAASGNDGALAVETMRELCADVRLFPSSTFRWRQDRRRPYPRLRALVQRLDPFEPVMLKTHQSSDATAMLAELARQPFDVIWVQRLQLLRCLPVFSGRVIVDLDDVEHRKLAHKLRRLPFSRRTPFEALDLVKTRTLERSLVRRPWEIVVCSATDRGALGSHPRVWVVPNGVDLPGDDRGRVAPPVPTFVFVGAMFYEPNVDAVRHFVTSIFPRIRAVLPRARFVIVGRDPAPSVTVLHDEHSVVVTGTVEDVAPYLRSASAVVVPLRYGGGTRIKILEAMAHRVPVVSTTVGAEGLDVVSGHHLLVADDPSAFAQACIRMATDTALGDRLAAQGRQLVERHYQWSQIERRVQQIVCAPETLERTFTAAAGPSPSWAATS